MKEQPNMVSSQTEGIEPCQTLQQNQKKNAISAESPSLNSSQFLVTASITRSVQPAKKNTNHAEIDPATLITELTAHNDLMREALEFCASDQADHIYFSTLPISPRTKGQVRAKQALSLAPSQSTTLFRNKVIQECIDKLQKTCVTCDGTGQVEDFEDGTQLPCVVCEVPIEALQALLEKEG